MLVEPTRCFVTNSSFDLKSTKARFVDGSGLTRATVLLAAAVSDDASKQEELESEQGGSTPVVLSDVDTGVDTGADVDVDVDEVVIVEVVAAAAAVADLLELGE